jgi:hypothetical protein
MCMLFTYLLSSHFVGGHEMEVHEHNPGMQQHSEAIPPPAENLATHAPNYNGMMLPVEDFQQGFNPSNGQFLMNGPPPGHRPAGPVLQLAPVSIPDVAMPQNANPIQNDVNLKKETLRLEKDEENPGFHLVAFSFDAAVSGRYAVICLCATDLYV